MKLVITMSRRFGTGASIIAEELSERLDIPVYDKAYIEEQLHGHLYESEAEAIRKLAENGQIATQYVDFNGNATGNIQFNPNGSYYAIEGITSPDGRVFGKMGHSERVGKNLYKNVAGNYDMGMFRSAVKYFK